MKYELTIGIYFVTLRNELQIGNKMKKIILGLMLLALTADTTQLYAQDAEWELVFSDEFNLPNGSQPNPNIWSRKYRNPDQCNRWNSDSKKVVYIKNGCLVCRAIPNKYEPKDTAKMLTGSVWTYGKYNVKYGKIEVRMRTNNKEGNFPAAWLKWQPSGRKDDRYAEIDIVEMFGNRGTANHNIHSQYTVDNANHGLKNSFSEKLNIKRWHIYGIEWAPDYVKWTVDGNTVGIFRKSSDQRLLAKGQWTFDVPCYIVLNQSLGDGKYEGMKPLLNTTYESRFDWIRVYKRK